MLSSTLLADVWLSGLFMFLTITLSNNPNAIIKKKKKKSKCLLENDSVLHIIEATRLIEVLTWEPMRLSHVYINAPVSLSFVPSPLVDWSFQPLDLQSDGLTVYTFCFVAFGQERISLHFWATKCPIASRPHRTRLGLKQKTPIFKS